MAYSGRSDDDVFPIAQSREFAFALGDTVRCSENSDEFDSEGVVRYFGRPEWADDGKAYVGIEIANAKEHGDGDGNDGQNESRTQYFEAEMGRALYVAAEHVESGL